MGKTNSVYIHIPFCTSICSYCDFCKIFYQDNLVNKYLDLLEQEIKNSYNNEKIKTIYIGGGTPSCLNLNQLKRLFSIVGLFNLDKLFEFTFECNINDLDKEKLEFLYLNKVNRLSIGIQTFNPKFLKLLNRKHTKTEVFNKIDMIKKIGFKNINVDLIYALPDESLADLNEDLDNFLKLDVNHISTYSLIIEKNTVFGINGLKQVNEDLDYEMYKLICKKLKEKGFKHYEISNFAKDNFFSKHNLTYWNNLEYYGFGLGATGYIDGIRYTNTRSIKNYLKGEYRYITDQLSKNEIIENEMILGLRKIDGVNKKDFYKKYGKKIEDTFNIKDMVDNNYLIDDSISIFVNEKYLYVENSILMKFIGGMNE